eukprot:UN17701
MRCYIRMYSWNCGYHRITPDQRWKVCDRTESEFCLFSCTSSVGSFYLATDDTRTKKQRFRAIGNKTC